MNEWKAFLDEEFKKEYFLNIIAFLEEESTTKIIYPKKEDRMNVFSYTPYNEIKVVILGQDPYHQPNQAHGLCFSVLKRVKVPPSLVNIYKELNSDLNCSIPSHGNLTSWAKQGVFLLNTTLTVEQGKANSHSRCGWNVFSDEVIKKINQKEDPVVFILWGKNARDKKKLITNEHHLIIEGVHPSPLSAYQGFFGSKPFSKCNAFLISKQIKPIDWQVIE